MDFNTAQLKRIKRANTDWWINEKSMVGKNGLTYIAYYNDIGEVHIKEIDAKCSRTPSRDVCLCRLNSAYADEHNAPSLCVMEDGTIVVVYTGHGTNAELVVHATERPYDLTSFGPPVRLPYEGSVTYAQLSENQHKGELWLFTRVKGKTWEFRYSSDHGKTWSVPHTFLKTDVGALFYFDIHHIMNAEWKNSDCVISERWFFALYGHPISSTYHKVHSGLFDADGNLLNMNGERTGVNLYEGGTLDLDALKVVYDSPENTTVRLCAVSPLPPYRVGLAAFVPGKTESITYYSAVWWDGAWKLSAPIAKGGEFLSPIDMTDGSQTYVGGMCYYYGVGEVGMHPHQPYSPSPVMSDRIYIARLDGDCSVLESYLTRDKGDSYQLEQVIRSVPRDTGIKLWRPIAPVYAQDNLPVYWHEGTYGAHTGGWHSDVVMYIDYDD